MVQQGFLVYVSCKFKPMTKRMFVFWTNSNQPRWEFQTTGILDSNYPLVLENDCPKDQFFKTYSKSKHPGLAASSEA